MQVKTAYPLGQLNTLRLNSSADYYICLTNLEQLPQINKFIQTKKLQFFTLGGGSNLILPECYHGLVIHNQLKGIRLINETTSYVDVRVWAGEVWDSFVEYTITHHWFGLENLSLIPGTAGAAPIQNIGAYGVEVKDFITQVEVYDSINNSFISFDKLKCNFSYRNSLFKTHPHYIVTAVVFRLRKMVKLNTSYADLAKVLTDIVNPDAMDLRQAVINIRNQKLPNPKIIANVGSFFHNPVLCNDKVAQLRQQYPKLPVYAIDENHAKVSAGWLIDTLGLKGYRDGNIGIYAKQALVLVNYATATKSEVLASAAYIQGKVWAEYGVRLNIEPVIIV